LSHLLERRSPGQEAEFVSITKRVHFPVTYLVGNILVKVLGVRWTLKIGLERCLGAMYIIPINTAKPRVYLAESANKLSTNEILTLMCSTPSDETFTG
jgi:hypothetical protein